MRYIAFPAVGRFRSLLFAVVLLGLSFACVPHATAAPLPPDVQKVVTALLAMTNATAPVPDKAALDTFLAYTTSPLNLTAPGESPPAPNKIGKAAGVLWRSRVNVPLATAAEYLFNPKVPLSMVYPASIRHASWQPGADILTLQTPLWKQIGGHKDAPLVLRGTELEEITPDTNSGAYYRYLLDRAVILTEYEGQRVIISISAQRGKSDVGKKAAFIGKYEDWDFVYSGVPGTLASGIGWAETYIYSSANISVFYEDAPNGPSTGYAMYRWMDAGWSGMNMVKDHHIRDGAERSFKGLKAFFESPRRPSSEAIAAYTSALDALDIAALQKRFMPYSVAVEKAATTASDLRSDDFQKVIAGAGYGKSMTKDEIAAAMHVNFVKQQLGMPLLAGPLDGKTASAQ